MELPLGSGTGHDVFVGVGLSAFHRCVFIVAAMWLFHEIIF